ncbi:hypothetical protein [Microbacterium suaedae]|uniref:hypothetical protein n=1 Tax=Microbacterium suaedae TaxID=2067813 RepID=UPI000DA201CC|nr:hypothetical protein [Microbacterium suaedae]
MLTYASLEEFAPEGAAELLRTDTDTFALVALRSADGEAQLLAAMPLDKRDVATTLTGELNTVEHDVEPAGEETAEP